MAKRVTATKANLIKTKSALNFAKRGYGLLDKKRAVLMREMMRLNARAQTIQQEVEERFGQSYDALTMASVTMGWESVVEMSKSMPTEEPYNIGYRSVMGVEIPEIHYKAFKPQTTFSMFESNFAFDEAYIRMHDMRARIYELAEIETDLYRLAKEIKKTVKRANALEKIQIPGNEAAKKEIEDILAEKEREDFFRLKRVKNNVSK